MSDLPITYIDDNGERLTELPSPMTNTDELGIDMLPPQETILTETWSIEDGPQSEEIQTEEKTVKMQQNEIYEPIRFTDEDFNRFFESLSDDEFAAFEKLLMEDFPEFASKDWLSNAQREADFSGSFSSEQLKHAIETLNRYASEEDSELASQLEKYLRSGEHEEK